MWIYCTDALLEVLKYVFHQTDLRRDLQQCHDDADHQLQELHQKDSKLNQLEQELQRQNRENNKLQNNIDSMFKPQNEQIQYNMGKWVIVNVRFLIG